MRQLILALLPLAALLAAPAAHAQGGEVQAGGLTRGVEMTDAEREAFRAEVRGYLLENPEILNEMVKILDERQKALTAQTDQQMVAANADELFNDGYSWVTGNPEAEFTVVEFLDYQCGYCRKAMPEVTELLESDGDIRMVVKDFPILGPGSELAARAATAAMMTGGPDAYGRLHDVLMTAKGQITDEGLDRTLREADLDPDTIRPAMDDPEVGRRIARNRALAERMAITGTPTFVFQSEMIRGYITLADMRLVVEEVRGAE